MNRRGFYNLLFLTPIFLCLSAISFGQKKDFADSEILVKFKTSVDGPSRNLAAARQKGSIAEALGDSGWFRVRIAAGKGVKSAIAEFQDLPEIEAAQPNFYYSIQVTPNDPGLANAGMYGLTKISAPLAWDITTGNNAVVVANIDTGVRYTHEDLAANMWVNPGEIAGNSIDDDANGFVDDIYGYDFRFNDPDPMDQNGHGTHTSGTLGAVGNNGIGVVGVNWNVKIMAIKIYSASGTDTTSAMLINAYNYVRMMKNRGINIRVTNNSYGGCNEACGFDQATKDAIDALGDAGILNVFAAGNSSVNIDSTPFYPASYTSPSILSVGASSNTDARFFNYGVVGVDLAAPGVSIYSTSGSADTGTSAYTTLSGTSMATPHVTGAAALLAGQNPSLSVASLKATLMNNVDQLPQWSGLVKSGGRLNVRAALQNPTVCTVGVNSDNILVPTKGGQLNLAINSAQNCDYSIKSNNSWIVVNGDTAISGNGQLKVWVRVNPTISRSGTVKVGDRIITIRQNRASNL